MVDKYKLKDRVTIIDQYISQARKADLFASALGCIYIPYEEDSYGYVTLEAYHARKPVITCADSGGTDVVVLDGKTGFMVPPDPKSRSVLPTITRLMVPLLIVSFLVLTMLCGLSVPIWLFPESIGAVIWVMI